MTSSLKRLRHLKALRRRIVADGRHTKIAAKLEKRLKAENKAVAEQAFSGLEEKPDRICPLRQAETSQGSSK